MKFNEELARGIIDKDVRVMEYISYWPVEDSIEDISYFPHYAINIVLNKCKRNKHNTEFKFLSKNIFKFYSPLSFKRYNHSFFKHSYHGATDIKTKAALSSFRKSCLRDAGRIATILESIREDTYIRHENFYTLMRE